MNGLMLDVPGSHVASLQDIFSVPVPEATETYCPVSNFEIVTYLFERTKTLLGLDVKRSEWGLSRKSQQMFGHITLDAGRDDNGLCIGLRNSYDKSLSLAIAVGSHVFVCSNLAFSSDNFSVHKRHTQNVRNSLDKLIDDALLSSQQTYSRMNTEFEVMKSIGVAQERGAEMLGLMLYHGTIKPQQASAAMKHWKNPPHEEFSHGNFYAFYNSVTEGLKRGTAGDTMDRYGTAHNYLRRYYHSQLPTDLRDVLPVWTEDEKETTVAPVVSTQPAHLLPSRQIDLD